MIKEFLKRWRIGVAWMRADELSARGNHEEALRLLRSVDEPFRSRVHWRLFEVFQLSLLRRHAETLKEALAFASELHSKTELSVDERYFLCFAQWCGSEAFRELFPATAVPEKLVLDLKSIEMGKVSPRWKRLFPMHIHPDWTAS
jgi:hypothetical protein